MAQLLQKKYRPRCAPRECAPSIADEHDLLHVALHAKSKPNAVDDIISRTELAASEAEAICVMTANAKLCTYTDSCRIAAMAGVGTYNDDFSNPRSCSLQIKRTRKRKIVHAKYAWSLLLLTVTFVKVVMNCPYLFVVASGDESIHIDDVDIISSAEENDSSAQIDPDKGERDDTNIESDASSPTEDPVPIPASLIQATRVGAKLREVRNPNGKAGEDTDDYDESQESDMKSPIADNADDVSHNSKPPIPGCHWGTMGCKKGKLSAGGPEMNSSSIETNDEDTSLGNEDGVNSSPSSSSLAGSATAKIEAHVMKGRGPKLGQRRPASKHPESNKSPRKETGGTGHNKPPQGFKLAGRIVTSPSDGLSYFLDPPRIDPESNDGDWMMTIPYAYLECGPTIESTTEAFSLADMVLRHFPASASMQHWTNLGGGVTIEEDVNEVDKSGGAKYIDGNHEGHPKLLVALSPIEITVSGNNEETRIFNSGEVILMEDTLGKGHKMRAAPVDRDKAESTKRLDAHDRDLSVLMVSLPHTVHFPMYEWLEESSYLSESSHSEESLSSDTPTDSLPTASTPTYGAVHSLFGFAPKHLHQKRRSLRKRSSPFSERLPCPLEYDSAYSSLFMPNQNQYRGQRRNRRNSHWGGKIPTSKGSSFDEVYPPPPGFTTYDQESVLFNYLPSLRRTMLFGLGLSLASSFIFCVQLLYPPLLVLWGGGTMIVGGSLLSVLATRWGYRNWVANWEEEWRWKREVRRNKRHREEAMEDAVESLKFDEDVQDDTIGGQIVLDHDSDDDKNGQIADEDEVETDSSEKVGTTQ